MNDWHITRTTTHITYIPAWYPHPTLRDDHFQQSTSHNVSSKGPWSGATQTANQRISSRGNYQAIPKYSFRFCFILILQRWRCYTILSVKFAKWPHDIDLRFVVLAFDLAPGASPILTWIQRAMFKISLRCTICPDPNTYPPMYLHGIVCVAPVLPS